MKKFMAFFKTFWLYNLTYRAEALVWLLLEAIPLVPIIALWKFLEGTGRINDAQSDQLIFYYILTLIINRLFSVHFDEWVIDHIKDGKISTAIIKPFSYRLYLLAGELTYRISGLVFLIPIALFLVPLFIDIQITSLSVSGVLLGLGVLVITYIQRFFMCWLISLTAFWMDQSKSLVHLRWMMEGILGGAWLPLAFFPVWWQQFAKFTPFYSWFYFPIQIISNNLNRGEMVFGLWLCLFWVIALGLLGNIMWKKAIAHYSAVGG